MKRLITVLAMCALLVAPAATYGACPGIEFTWDGSTSTAWNAAANWTYTGDPGLYPGSTANNGGAIIDDTSSYVPLLDSNRTICYLTMDNVVGLDVNGYTLTVTGAFTVNSGSTITISNSDSGGGITAASFVMNGASTITVSGTTTVQTN